MHNFEKIDNMEFLRIEGAEFTKNPFPVKCDLTVIKKESGTIVVASQPKNHNGASVTNSIEIIRSSVVRNLKLCGRVIWVEHYPKGFSILDSKYTLMEIEFYQDRPQWHSLTTWEELSRKYEVPIKFLASGYEDELECK